MKIQELELKNFGKFKDKKVELSEGINIIYGENESGKSTLHTFIKGMLFGIGRGRGRASVNDTFSRYEPWENSNYYSGALRFESGGKHFIISRNFDKYSRKSELICEDDGEELSVDDGDLEMILEGLTEPVYENTVSAGQLKIETGQSLAAELRNYATNYYAAGSGEIDLEETILMLKNRKKELEKEVKASLLNKQRKREKLEQETSYVWRDVHRLSEEKERISQELEYREEKTRQETQENKGVIDEIRPGKWRIHPVEIIVFAAIIILAFILIAKPWNYLVAIVLFLLCGIYVWNRMKVSKKQEKTEPEKILEEITSEEEKLPIEKLKWERDHVIEELREKQIQYSNLQEQLEELDEVSSEYKAQDKKKEAVELAADTLEELSAGLRGELEEALNRKASKIMECITGGKYTKVWIESSLHMCLMSYEKRIPIEQVSRGTVEQTYFALRMAASELLHEEEYPVILDDTFGFYDDDRLCRTLRWLYENKKQVIIFTCQKREDTFLREMGIPAVQIEL